MPLQQSRIAKQAEKFILHAVIGLFDDAPSHRSGLYLKRWGLVNFNFYNGDLSSASNNGPFNASVRT